MYEDNGLLDEHLIDMIKRYPIVDLVALVFPDHSIRGRGRMCSPFREDRNPSFSCFTGRGGYGFWKDHATGEFGDNIEFYRKAYPHLSYVEAVDSLAMLIYGCHARRDCGMEIVPVMVNVPKRNASRRNVYSADNNEESAKLTVIDHFSLDDARVPRAFNEYWRGRGISDDIIKAMGCGYFTLENANRKGRFVVDPSSGLPILDKDGREMVDDGISHALGIYNNIGGVIFRVPDTAVRKGFKGCTSSFVSTFLADNSRPARIVSFIGDGDSKVTYPYYEPKSRRLMVNDVQGFGPVEPFAASAAQAFMQNYSGTSLNERDVMNITAVMNDLNCPVSNAVAVVEGMFDGFSEREVNKFAARGSGKDLVILNSINNLRWAIPFLARHREITLLLDNDLRSSAGQKASAAILSEVEQFNTIVGGTSVIFNGSSLFEGYKDLNDALMANKGFAVKKNGEDDEHIKRARGRRR